MKKSAPKNAEVPATNTNQTPQPVIEGMSKAHEGKKTKAAAAGHAKSPCKTRPATAKPHLVPLWPNRWLVVADPQALEATAKCAMQALANSGEFFLMAGKVIELTHSKPSGLRHLRMLDEEDIACALERKTEIVAIRRSAARLVPGPSSAQLAKLIMRFRAYSTLPALKGIVERPANRQDGSVIAESGYDKASGLYVVERNANPKRRASPLSTGDLELDDLLESLG